MHMFTLTWNTFGALTKLAKAEESVAANIPAVTIGPNPDILSITCAYTQIRSYFTCASKCTYKSTCTLYTNLH